MDNEELEKDLNISEGEKNQELEDIMNLLNSSEDDIININDNNELFEGLSQEELNLLMQEDENLDVDDIDTDVLNNIAVYGEEEETNENQLMDVMGNTYDINDMPIPDDGLNEMSEEEFKKLAEESQKKESKLNKTSIILICIAILLIILIILTSIIFSMAIKKANNNAIKNEIKKDIKLASYTPNDKNTVYFDMAKELDGKTIILEKMSINNQVATFYFKNKIILPEYNITLTDNDENVYIMDFNFTKANGSDRYSMLKFSGIKELVSGLKLTFESINTKEKVVFNLDFDLVVQNETIKYINNKIENNFGNYNVNINYGEFSNDSSRIDYTLEPARDVKYEIQQGALGETNFIQLKQDNINISALSDKPTYSNIGNKVIGTMKFNGVPNIDEDIVLKFDDIYKKYTTNQTFSLTDINSGNVQFNFDEYRITLEGIHKFDNKYVLVLNAKNTTISTENRPDDFNNVEVKLDLDLIAKSKDGVEVIISPTQIKSAKFGTDIIFELDEHQIRILNRTSAEDIGINIKSILLKQDSISIPIDLTRALTRPIISYQLVEENIEKAFKSRLENRNSIGSIRGFSDDVLANTILMSEYTYLPKNNVKNAINILSKDINGDEFEAIVQEGIQINDGDNTKVIYRNHKIKANNTNDNFIIYYDELIK